MNTSGIRIWWNGHVIRDVESAEDYEIHTETFFLQAVTGENMLSLEGRAISDGVGMSCTHIIFNLLTNYHRLEVSGRCTCDTGYFDDFVNYPCQKCSAVDPYCLICENMVIN